MKKFAIVLSAITLSTATAMAADMPTKAPPLVAPVAVYNWSGFYVGAHLGYGWAENASNELPPGSGAFPTGTIFPTNNEAGWLGGVQGGFNWQFNSVVLGVEGEFSWADLTGHTTAVSVPFPTFVSNTSATTDEIATAAGRLGWAVNNWLFYGKGGWAWTHGFSDGIVTNRGTIFTLTNSSAERNGWVAGVGFEWGFTPNASIKLEYDHLDLGSQNVTILSTASPATFVNSSLKIDEVKLGFNYRFNWGHWGAPY